MILQSYKTDHSLVILKFDFGKLFKKKKALSNRKSNNSLLKNNKYIDEVKQ